MSRKLCKLRVARVNNSVLFVTEKGLETKQIARQFDRYEGTPAETVLPVAFTDKPEGEKKLTVGQILESREFAADDLPFVL